MKDTAALNRAPGPWQAASVVAGTSIGTGIFLKTARMTQPASRSTSA